MAKKKTYYSIRVVKATNKKKAIEKVENEKFDESHRLSDEVLLTKELLQKLLLELED